MRKKRRNWQNPIKKMKKKRNLNHGGHRVTRREEGMNFICYLLHHTTIPCVIKNHNTREIRVTDTGGDLVVHGKIVS